MALSGESLTLAIDTFTKGYRMVPYDAPRAQMHGFVSTSVFRNGCASSR